MNKEQIKHTASEIVRSMTNFRLTEEQKSALMDRARIIIATQFHNWVKEEIERKKFPEELYDDKEFYEVLSNGDLTGPIRGIREVSSDAIEHGDGYRYCQIYDNKIVAVFKENEIVLKVIVMGWFSNPKCPQCGRESTPTGYSFPYPPYQCKPCKRDNAKQQELEDRIKRLEKRLESK